MRAGRCVSLLIVLSASAPAAGNEPPPVAVGEARTVTVDPAGAAVRLRHVPDAAGTLYLAAESAAADPRLEVRDGDGGELATDEDGGGGTTAFVRVDVLPGRPLTIAVGAAGDAPADVVVRLAMLPAASPEQAARLLEVKDGLHRMESATLPALVDELLAIAEETPSDLVLELLWEAAGVAYTQRLRDQALRCVDRVLAVREPLLPDSHPDLARAHLNRAGALSSLGRHAAAVAAIERSLSLYQRAPPPADEHAGARLMAAIVLRDADERERAGELTDAVIAERQALAPDDPLVLQGHIIRAGISYLQGDLVGTRLHYEGALAIAEPIFPAADPRVLDLQNDYAVMLTELGETFEAVRVLSAIERAVADRPGHDPIHHRAQVNLAIARQRMGDLAGARELQEQILAARLAAFPDADPLLQADRQNLANTLVLLGHPEEARPLLERALDVLTELHGQDGLEVQRARINLSTTHVAAGDPAAARPLLEQAAAALERTLPPEHPHVLRAQTNLGNALRLLGDTESAARLESAVLATRRRVLPAGHRELQLSLRNLAWTLSTLGREDEAAALARECARSIRDEVARRALTATPREVEAAALHKQNDVSFLLSLGARAPAAAAGPLAADLFHMVETLRGADLLAARIGRSAAGDPELDRLRREVQSASQRVARAVAAQDRDALSRAWREQEQARGALFRRAAEQRGVDFAVEPSLAALAAGLADDEALIAWSRYLRCWWTEEDVAGSTSEDMLAFVVRPDGTLTRVELGPLGEIRRAAADWRRAVADEAARRHGPSLRLRTASSLAERDAERERGEALRRLVLDPVLAATGAATRLVVTLDDVLHLIPLDALPAGDGRVGDRLRVETRATSWERLLGPAAVPGAGAVLLLGDVAYGDAGADGVRGSDRPGAPVLAPDGSVEFPRLPGTAAEVAELAALAQARDFTAVTLLTGEEATRGRFAAGAPGAAFLHLATHGYFAPESVRSAADPLALDAAAGAVFASLEEQVLGLSPMVLCGLVLAGPTMSGADGRVSAIITAEEIAALDLRGCRLAVLSACETSVGARRAGQGTASLQRAFHMAGTGQVVASVWNVPDAATRDLMVAFYRRIWADGMPPRQALWEAKRALREQRDRHGRPRYTVRDWAGWVLTGS